MAGIKFHYLGTAHQGWLAVRRADDGICHVHSDEMTRRDENGDPVYVPLLAMALSDQPDYLFLFRAPEEGRDDVPSIWLKHFSYKGSILPFLRVDIPHHDGWVGLRNPLCPSLCCTAQPWGGGPQVNDLLGDCHHMMGWEHFQLHEVLPAEPFQTLGKALAACFRASPSVEYVRELIEGYEGPYLGWVLDAMTPMMTRPDLRQLGELLLKDQPLLEKLCRKMGNSIWREAWQILSRWWQDRDSSRAAERGCPLGDEVLTRGDINAPAGFGQIVLHTARASIKPRRKVCMMSTIRNEGIYVLEWIAYHRSLGVEHFFIYSNDNNDCSDVLLSALQAEGLITFIDNAVLPGMSAQTKAYGHGLNILPDILDYEWCFILDGDEFITLSPRYEGIADYLKSFSRWECDAIALNWKFIASEVNHGGLSDLVKPLTQRNSQIVSRGGIGEGWRLVKSAVRPGKAIQSRPHHPVWMSEERFTYRQTDGSIHAYRNPPPGIGADPAFADRGFFDDLYISHYYYKSIIEWVWKYARNSGLDGSMSFGVERYADYWANAFICQMNDPHEGDNLYLQHRLAGMVNELIRLRGIESIALAENIVRSTWQERLLALLDMVEEADVASRLKEEWRYVLDPLAIERQGSIPLHQF